MKRAKAMSIAAIEHAEELAKKFGHAEALKIAKGKNADLLFMVASPEYIKFWVNVQKALEATSHV